MDEKTFFSEYNPREWRTPDGFPCDACIFTITREAQESVRKTKPISTLKILLIKRKEHPFKDKWAFPGGFSRENENLYQAMKRELKEKANIGEDFHIEQIKTIYYPGRDPRPNPEKTGTAWMPTTVFCALVKEEHLQNLYPGDHAKEARLFSIEEARNLDFAFDHKQILFGGLKELAGEDVEAYAYIQNKMMSTSIAKEFLAEEFTLSELHSVIKTVVPEFKEEVANFGRKLLKTKFRSGIIEEVVDEYGASKTSNSNSQMGAKLYRFTEYNPKVSLYTK